jgi:hypothetical protein
MPTKYSQMVVKYFKRPEYMYSKQFPRQGPPKFTQIGIFGQKIKHLATLHPIDPYGFLARNESFVSFFLFVPGRQDGDGGGGVGQKNEN